MVDQQSEITYIKRILDGETHLFSYFLDNYSHQVFSMIVRIVSSREDAEELTQDTFLKAYRKLDTYRGDCSFSTWLFRIGYNTAISSVRKRKLVFPAIDDTLMNSIPDETVDILSGISENEEMLRQMEQAIGRLNPYEKALITLYYLQNKPVQELSEIFGIGVENVKVRLFRTRKKLYGWINSNIQS